MNRVTLLLKIKHPILLGAMAGITDAEMAAAVSESGGLGTIASAGETPESLSRQIAEIRHLTNKPFAVNIPMVSASAKMFLEIALHHQVPVVITSAGNPGNYINMFKLAGIKLIQVVPSAKLAQQAEKAGVDAVIAEGFESGGIASYHEIGTLALIPRVVDVVNIPVIAAGGIADVRGFVASLALGAEGISVGTAFLAAKECEKIGQVWKNRILKGTEQSTRIVGRGIFPVRMLKNDVSEYIDQRIKDGADKREILDILFKKKTGQNEEGAFPCGQGIGLLLSQKSIAEILDGFIGGEMGDLINALKKSI